MTDDKLATTVLEVLIRARDGCAKPGGWMQNSCCPEDDDGCQTQCCCALGWMNKAGTGDARASYFVLGDATFVAFRKVVWNCITDWNDAKGRTQAQVVAAFDKAIARERAKL